VSIEVLYVRLARETKRVFAEREDIDHHAVVELF
jgi:hypothetical protein